MKTIADRLKEAREAARLTQEQVATAAAVSQGTIANIEAGLRKSPRELLAIAAAVGVRAEWLKTGSGPRFHDLARGAPYPPGPGDGTAQTVAMETHLASLRAVTVAPDYPVLGWATVQAATDLPPSFIVQAPDDALAPDIPRGMRVLMDRYAAQQLEPGDGVLVETADGLRALRMYAQKPGGGWVAQARHPAYASFDSQQAQLRVLAVLAAKMSRKVGP